MHSTSRPAAIRVATSSPEWADQARQVARGMRLAAEINKLGFDDTARIRELFGELTGQLPDDGFRLIPPFYTAGGNRIRVGRRVFINQCCTIYDLGGVDIGDRVMIGPNVSLITDGHAMEPSQRRAWIEARPIVIGANVWIAAGATIVGGVSVGENSVVGAGAVVTRDVPPNCFAAGVPARVLRRLDEAGGEGLAGMPPGAPAGG